MNELPGPRLGYLRASVGISGRCDWAAGACPYEKTQLLILGRKPRRKHICRRFTGQALMGPEQVLRHIPMLAPATALLFVVETPPTASLRAG